LRAKADDVAISTTIRIAVSVLTSILISPAEFPRLATVIGARMREQRFALSMSQERLGQELGVSFQQIQKYESGKNRVSAARLFVICKALNVSLSSMFEDDPTK
jgi:DNA-binding XRE family transcriptional regulator